MRRRQFIAGLGTVATWPVVARAQQGERVWPRSDPVDGEKHIKFVHFKAGGLPETGRRL